MGELLDDLARLIAGRQPRRRMLRSVRGLVAGAALSTTRLGRATAQQLGECGCWDYQVCCKNPDGGFRGCCQDACCAGRGACPKGGFCCAGLCWPKGTTCCSGTPCRKGLGCCYGECVPKGGTCCGQLGSIPVICSKGEACCGASGCYGKGEYCADTAAGRRCHGRGGLR
jgi:hypothetical protein